MTYLPGVGSSSMLGQLKFGRDPKYWTDDETFKPQRFLDSSIDCKGTKFELPSIAFAIADIELPLANLLHHFDWKLPNGIKHQELDMNELYGFTARSQNGLHLIPIIHHPITSLQLDLALRKMCTHRLNKYLCNKKCHSKPVFQSLNKRSSH